MGVNKAFNFFDAKKQKISSLQTTGTAKEKRFSLQDDDLSAEKSWDDLESANLALRGRQKLTEEELGRQRMIFELIKMSQKMAQDQSEISP